MKNVIAVITVLLVLSLASLAGAVTYQYSGTIDFTSDVRRFDLHLANDVIDVRIWTDSWQNGANFDPYIILWTGSGVYIDENDDIDGSNYDSYLSRATLSAGDYIITLLVNVNTPIGSLLSEGYSLDSMTPPDPITTYGGQGNYHVVFDAVPVPEPSTFLLFAGGLLGVGMLRKKFKV